ncbi:MAG: hypothetical protein R2748_18225 [Bryobacterales bacterium]
MADPVAAVPESNEANNEATFPLSVPASLLPDLAPTGVTTASALDANGKIDVTLNGTLLNSGPSQAFGARLQFAVSADGGVTFTDVGSSVSAGNIPGGVGRAAQRLWQNVAPGAYVVRLTADQRTLSRRATKPTTRASLR